MNLGIVVADFHKEIAKEMLDAAKKAAKNNGLNVKEISYVSGVFDVPLPLKRLLARPDIHACVVLGAVVQGETSHDEIVAHTSASKIADLSLKFDKPVGYGISGPRMTKEQAQKRAEEFAVRAVETAVRMLEN